MKEDKRVTYVSAVLAVIGFVAVFRSFESRQVYLDPIEYPEYPDDPPRVTLVISTWWGLSKTEYQLKYDEGWNMQRSGVEGAKWVTAFEDLSYDYEPPADYD